MPADIEVRLADGDHVVQFYDRVVDHLTAVTGYLTTALADGDAIVVVARPDRCAALESAVAAAGVDIAAARAEGRVVTIDAEVTLSRITVDGSPDAARFDEVIGGLIRNVLPVCPVRVYGEMVGVLWDAGDVAGAIELEELWCRLAERLPFSLFCGYDGSETFGPDEVDAFAEVCHRHSAVIGGAPALDADVSRRFARSTYAPGAARRFVTETLEEWDIPSLAGDGALVISELATNAVLHADSDFTVGLSLEPGSVRLAVGDSSPVVPLIRDPATVLAGGRGLRVVATLASRWGSDVVAGGKVVWADLPTHPFR